MIGRISMVLLLLLFIMGNVVWAGELTQVGETPAGTYYFDGTHVGGGTAQELQFEILFVPTVKEEKSPDHTIFVYVVDLDEKICYCTERKDYDKNNKLYNDYFYERLIRVPIEQVDIIVNTLKIISEQDGQSLAKLDPNRFNTANALLGVEYITGWLKSFTELTTLTTKELSLAEKQQIGNLGPEMQSIGFYNWPKVVAGTLYKQEYEIAKLEYELAVQRQGASKVSPTEVNEKQKKYQDTKHKLENFLAQLHIAD